MVNYFIYCRKSTDVEDKQVRSIGDQLAVLRTLAKEEGLNIVDEFIEKQSAKVPGRPIFTDMLSRIEKGEAQGISAGSSTAWLATRLTAVRSAGCCNAAKSSTFKPMTEATSLPIMF
jgi:hypothetical protein